MAYVVIENTPGYLPEGDDPYVTDDLASAVECLRDDVRRHYEWIQDNGEECDIWIADDGRSAFVKRIGEAGKYDLGRAFEVIETDEEVTT